MNYFFCCDIYVLKLKKNRTFIITRATMFLNYFIFAVQCFFAICKSTKLLNFTKLKIS